MSLPHYQRLHDPERDDVALDGSYEYEIWQFRRAKRLHLGIVSVGLVLLLTLAFVFDFNHPALFWTDVRDAVAFSVLLALRAAADHPSLNNHKQLTRRAFVACFVAYVPLGSISWTMGVAQRTDIKMSEWLMHVLNCIVAISAFAPLSITLPFDARFFVFFLLVSTGPMAYVVLNLATWCTDPSELPAIRQAVYAGIGISWALSIVVYVIWDRQNRDLFNSLKTQGELASAKGRYIAAISHDFGTPIAALRMLLSQIATNSVLAAAYAPFARRANAALDLLSTVREKAINLNKLEHGLKLQPEKSTFSIRELIGDVREVAESMAKGPTCNLYAQIDDAATAHDAILTDRGWLYLILINFLSNAFKHVREGTVVIDVSLAEHEPCADEATAHRMLRLQVTDNGQGVPEATVPHLFTAYTRASKYRFGTGLGLYHVAELASALDGEARHAHNVPHGAIFWVDVPVVLMARSPPSLVAPAHAAPDAQPTVVGGTSATNAEAGPAGPAVLVVDDDAFIRDLVVMLLSEHTNASRIEVAADGLEGLALLKKDGASQPPPFALVLMDLQMPHMDGLTCIREFRAWEDTQQHGQRTLAVAVSANGDDAGWREECMQAGFDDVVDKPIGATTLSDLLVRAERLGGNAV